MTIKELKKELGWTNKDIATLFQYKNQESYYASSARPRIEKALCEFHAKLEAREDDRL